MVFVGWKAVSGTSAGCSRPL